MWLERSRVEQLQDLPLDESGKIQEQDEAGEQMELSAAAQKAAGARCQQAGCGNYRWPACYQRQSVSAFATSSGL